MVFPDFNPVIVQLGPFALRWYALAYVAGILLGWRYAVGLVRNARLWGPRTPTVTVPQIDDLVLWITLGVIIGGRLGYVLFYMLPSAQERPFLFAHPWEILEIWHGGMSFHGGAIGVALAVIGFARVNRIDMLLLADVVAPCQPIGQFFGRIANFINGELWGRVTHGPWGMIFCSPHIRMSNGGDCPAGLDPRTCVAQSRPAFRHRRGDSGAYSRAAPLPVSGQADGLPAGHRAKARQGGSAPRRATGTAPG